MTLSFDGDCPSRPADDPCQALRSVVSAACNLVGDNGRPAASDRMREDLDVVEVDGIATSAAYLAACVEHPEFRAGDVTADFIAGITRRCRRPGDWARGRRIVSTRAGILRPRLMASYTIRFRHPNAPAMQRTPLA